MPDEEGYYQKKAMDYFESLISKDGSHDYKFMKHPTVLDCLGIRPESPKVEIKEGFVRASYILDIDPADEACLFNKHNRNHRDWKLFLISLI